MQCGIDNMHTHFQVKLQSGEEILAIAEPGKKKETTSGAAARSNIWCAAALRAVEIEPLRVPEMAHRGIYCWWMAG